VPAAQRLQMLERPNKSARSERHSAAIGHEMPIAMRDAQSRPVAVRVLFLCTGNACRSQMAEGWARHLKADVIEPYSAGVHPAGLSRNAVRVMAEAGVDISGHRSKHVDELATMPFDYVVTVCDDAHESCPVFPGATKVVHHSFDDPPRLAAIAATEEERLAAYRRVRDEIRDFVATLPEALEAASETSPGRNARHPHPGPLPEGEREGRRP
jgi:arsenate reductase